MSNRTKNILYTGILLLSVFIVYQYRNRSQHPVFIEGKTMGTTYHITYFDTDRRDFKLQVDSILNGVNQAINTYLPQSEVTRFNKGTGPVKFELPYLQQLLERSQEIVSASSGAFDPTVMPLVNAWGFGPAEPLNPDNLEIDSIREFIGFEKVGFNADSVWKTDARTQLDFGGIGQGYGADVVVEFLKSKGITDMLVEIGGEGMAVGRNRKTGRPWEIGILDPNSTREDQFFKAYVSLENKSFTTSGNYFNYREIDGKKFSHTIDPQSGYPVNNPLLSVSVFSADATSADGWATALMVMGVEKAMEVLHHHPELDALLMYSGDNGLIEMFITPGIEDQVTLKKYAWH
ncbi:MAG: FAD:protein FMN transferase [Cyclobacteriaceae bacterium]|nr:FAD:protein FMN transferase [Cyclobacteriaceae bacterium]